MSERGDAELFQLLIGQRRELVQLDGVRLEDLLDWVGSRVGSKKLALPDYEMPEHPVAQGEALRIQGKACDELMRWFGNGYSLLAAIASEEKGASPVRTWPHHFDMATLIDLGEAGSGESGRSVNVGLSPGDTNYEEPYLYVSPWPYPQGYEKAALPPLAGGGHWHTSGFLAAILTGTDLVSQAGVDKQFDLATAFIDSATSHSRSMALEGLAQ